MARVRENAYSLIEVSMTGAAAPPVGFFRCATGALDAPAVCGDCAPGRGMGPDNFACNHQPAPVDKQMPATIVVSSQRTFQAKGGGGGGGGSDAE